MAKSDRPLSKGDRAPDFVLREATGTLTRFYGFAGGRPMALVFCTGLEQASLLAGALGLEIVAVVAGPIAEAPSFRAFTDPEGAVRASYRIAEDRVVVLDPNLRVVGVFAPEAHADIRAAAITPLEPAIEIGRQAPVLLIPDALDLELRKEAIEVLQARGGAWTGVERSEDGRRTDALDDAYKQRRDHVVDDPDLMRRFTEAVGARVVPEVERAFSFRATRFEGFKIACYEVGGFFKPHRDNLSPSTAHRRFALTLNLNDDYRGGQIRFPEHAPHLYRPPAGGALVFSCSLLHEALPVLEGQRFVLLSFLFGTDDRRARQK